MTYYVCTQEIKTNPFYVGKGLYRHRSKCVPLSKNWEKFKQGNMKLNSQKEFSYAM